MKTICPYCNKESWLDNITYDNQYGNDKIFKGFHYDIEFCEIHEPQIFKDKLRRRNMQIKELKQSIENYRSCLISKETTWLKLLDIINR